MKVPELATLVQWLDAAGISDFEMKEPGRFIRVVMQGQGGAGPGSPAVAAASGRTRQVVAPAPGAFLAAHPLRAKPLADVGAPVAAGDILGLVKVDGVLYQPVLAGHGGRMSRRWVVDGDRVDDGMLLFDIASGAD